MHQWSALWTKTEMVSNKPITGQTNTNISEAFIIVVLYSKQKRYPSPWHVLSLLHFNYRSNTVSCILPKTVFESLGKTTYLTFFWENGQQSTLVTTGPLKAIAKIQTTKVIDAELVRKQQMTQSTSNQDVTVVRDMNEIFRMSYHMTFWIVIPPSIQYLNHLWITCLVTLWKDFHEKVQILEVFQTHVIKVIVLSHHKYK